VTNDVAVTGQARRGSFSTAGGRSYLATALDVGPQRHSVSWSVSAGAVTDRLDPLLAASLLPAMHTRLPIRIDGPVSPALIEGVRKIQQLYARWDPTICQVDVVAPVGEPVRRSSRAAAFFSGGVDSFHTAIRHSDEIDALVFVQGFDIRLERRSLLERVSQAVRAAADELGKPLVEVRTDIKRMSRQYAPWSWFHGSALASVAHLLAPSFGRIYVPGSLSYDYPHPYGSHPLVDPLWSTDAVEIIYDGFDTNRIEKTAVVARNPVALRWLRVCNDRDDDGYNCGRCEKCLRTMVSLELLGALPYASTLPDHIDPAAVARLNVVWNRDLWEQNLAFADGSRASPALVAAVRAVLNRGGPDGQGWEVRWAPRRS
jgi:hypothetical protein